MWTLRCPRFRASPTRMYLFELAEKLGSTVASLKAGQQRPLSGREFTQWLAFELVRAEQQAEAQERQKNEIERRSKMR